MSRRKQYAQSRIAEIDQELKDLADARTVSVGLDPSAGRVQRLEQERDSHLRTIASEDDVADEVAALEAASHAKAKADRESEEAAFWFRRFFTSLAIANGAAFVALAAGFMQADDRPAIAGLLPAPMKMFLLGMLAAGTIPILFWARLALRGWVGDHPRRKWMLAANWPLSYLVMISVLVSIAALGLGLMMCVEAVETFI